MKFTSVESIQAPIDFVFEQVTDFEHFERMVERRGISLRRTSPKDVYGAGMSWQCKFDFRGKKREGVISLDRLERSEYSEYSYKSNTVNGGLIVRLSEMSPEQTRMEIEVRLQPRSLGARLLVQSLKLVKNKANAQIAKRVAGLANEIEWRYRQGR